MADADTVDTVVGPFDAYEIAERFAEGVRARGVYPYYNLVDLLSPEDFNE
jgi:hypothetical protein